MSAKCINVNESRDNEVSGNDAENSVLHHRKKLNFKLY